MNKLHCLSLLACVSTAALLAGCGGGGGHEAKDEAQRQVKEDAGAARKQLDKVKSIVMQNSELSGGDAAGKPLWRLAAKEIRVYNEDSSLKADKDPDKKGKDAPDDKFKQFTAQPKRAELTEAKAMLYKEGKLDATFNSPRAIVNYAADGSARITMIGGIKAKSEGGWSGKRGIVTMAAPKAEVNVKTRTVFASGGVHMIQGTGANRIFAKAGQLVADVGLKTTHLKGGVKATTTKGQFMATMADWNWETHRAVARGSVKAINEGTTITGSRLEADTTAGRGVLSGGVRATGDKGNASASSVRYDWKNHTVEASGGVTLDKGEAVVTASELTADDKFENAVASGGVTLKKGDSTLRAGHVEVQGKGENANASGGVTLFKGDVQVSASRASAYNLGSKNISVVGQGEVKVRRGDLTITAGRAQATGLQDKKSMRVVASDGVYARNSDGAVRASNAVYSGGQIVATGSVTLYRDGNELSGSRLVCDDKFETATLTGSISGNEGKGGSLTAGKMVYRKGKGVVASEGVSARRGQLRMRADNGTSDPDGSHLVFTGNCVVVNADGTRLMAREVRYDRDASKVYADGDVYLQDGKTGVRQHGRKLVADLRLKQATLTDVSGSGKMDVFKDKKLFD